MYDYNRTKTAFSRSWGGAVVGWMSELLGDILKNLPRGWKGGHSMSKLGSSGWFSVIEGYTSADLEVRVQIAVTWHKGKVNVGVDSQVVGRGQERLVTMDLGFDEDPGAISRVLNQYLSNL